MHYIRLKNSRRNKQGQLFSNIYAAERPGPENQKLHVVTSYFDDPNDPEGTIDLFGTVCEALDQSLQSPEEANKAGAQQMNMLPQIENGQLAAGEPTTDNLVGSGAFMPSSGVQTEDHLDAIVKRQTKKRLPSVAHARAQAFNLNRDQIIKFAEEGMVGSNMIPTYNGANAHTRVAGQLGVPLTGSFGGMHINEFVNHPVVQKSLAVNCLKQQQQGSLGFLPALAGIASSVLSSGTGKNIVSDLINAGTDIIGKILGVADSTNVAEVP